MTNQTISGHRRKTLIIKEDVISIFLFVRDYTGVVKRPGDADVVVDGQS